MEPAEKVVEIKEGESLPKGEIKDETKAEKEPGACCCYVVDPCGCYVDPCWTPVTGCCC